jgi:hypothetical protein
MAKSNGYQDVDGTSNEEEDDETSTEEQLAAAAAASKKKRALPSKKKAAAKEPTAKKRKAATKKQARKASATVSTENPTAVPKERKNFHEVEDCKLAESWLYVTEDSITGANQTSQVFWGKVKKAFDAYMEDTPLPDGIPHKIWSQQALDDRWKRKINKDCMKFTSHWRRIKLQKPSGHTDEDITKVAMEAFWNELKRPFKFLSCWKILKDGSSKFNPMADEVDLENEPEDDTDDEESGEKKPKAKVNQFPKMQGEGRARPKGSKTSKASVKAGNHGYEMVQITKRMVEVTAEGNQHMKSLTFNLEKKTKICAYRDQAAILVSMNQHEKAQEYLDKMNEALSEKPPVAILRGQTPVSHLTTQIDDEEEEDSNNDSSTNPPPALKKGLPDQLDEFINANPVADATNDTAQEVIELEPV